MYCDTFGKPMKAVFDLLIQTTALALLITQGRELGVVNPFSAGNINIYIAIRSRCLYKAITRQ